MKTKLAEENRNNEQQVLLQDDETQMKGMIQMLFEHVPGFDNEVIARKEIAKHNGDVIKAMESLQRESAEAEDLEAEQRSVAGNSNSSNADDNLVNSDSEHSGSIIQVQSDDDSDDSDY